METKRKAFPRFYFLSNDELIDVLARSKDMKVVQQHLKTLFDNMAKVTIVDENVEPIIEEIHAHEGEILPLKKQVRTKDVIEKWLDQLQF